MFARSLKLVLINFCQQIFYSLFFALVYLNGSSFVGNIISCEGFEWWNVIDFLKEEQLQYYFQDPNHLLINIIEKKFLIYGKHFNFQADFRLVDKIGLLVPLEAVQACCYIEKKSQKPPKDLKSEMVDSG